MNEADVIILGSGPSALAAASVVASLGLDYFFVDMPPLGGSLATVGRTFRYTKIPIFLPKQLVDMLNCARGCEALCGHVEKIVLKAGALEAKIKGYMDEEFQKLRPLEWSASKESCYVFDPLGCVENYLGVSLRGARAIASSVRRLDLDRRVVALSVGTVVRYRRGLIYTWPIDALARIAVSKEAGGAELQRELTRARLCYVSMFVSSFIAKDGADSSGRAALTLHYHGTRASRFHTAVEVHLGKLKILYMLTSHSRSYPLIAGIGEKLLSESKKYRLLDPTEILERNDVNVRYALLCRADDKALKDFAEKLAELRVALLGRLGSWKDIDLYEVLAREPVERAVVSALR